MVSREKEDRKNNLEGVFYLGLLVIIIGIFILFSRSFSTFPPTFQDIINAQNMSAYYSNEARRLYEIIGNQ